MANFTPSQLATLSCDELAAESAVVRQSQALEQEWALYKQMQQTPPPCIGKTTTVCRACGRSDRLTVIARQTRSADEGMGIGHRARVATASGSRNWSRREAEAPG